MPARLSPVPVDRPATAKKSKTSCVFHRNRFTPDEAAEFLNRVMGLSLSPDDIAAPSVEKAQEYLDRVEEDRRAWVRQFYSVDWDVFTLYDMVLNLEKMSMESATELVVVPSPSWP